MSERSFRHDTGWPAVDRADDRGSIQGVEWRGGAGERSELAAFFKELGLGWEIDAEGLVDRLADPRGLR